MCIRDSIPPKEKCLNFLKIVCHPDLFDKLLPQLNIQKITTQTDNVDIDDILITQYEDETPPLTPIKTNNNIIHQSLSYPSDDPHKLQKINNTINIPTTSHSSNTPNVPNNSPITNVSLILTNSTIENSATPSPIVPSGSPATCINLACPSTHMSILIDEEPQTTSSANNSFSGINVPPSPTTAPHCSTPSVPSRAQFPQIPISQEDLFPTYNSTQETPATPVSPAESPQVSDSSVDENTSQNNQDLGGVNLSISGTQVNNIIECIIGKLPIPKYNNQLIDKAIEVIKANSFPRGPEDILNILLCMFCKTYCLPKDTTYRNRRLAANLKKYVVVEVIKQLETDSTSN